MPSSRLSVAAWRRPAAEVAAIALVVVSIPAGDARVGDGPRLDGLGDGVGDGGLRRRASIDRPARLPLAALPRDRALDRAARLRPRPRAALDRWVTGLLIVLFVLAPPLLSLDVYSYISYARLGADHGSTHTSSPRRRCPGDDARAGSSTTGTRSPSTARSSRSRSYPLGLVSVPVALWSLKAVAGLSIAALAALVARIAASAASTRRSRWPSSALNPLVLVHLVGGAHNDALMAAIAMAAGRGGPLAAPGDRRRRLRRRGRGQGLRPALRAVRAVRRARARRPARFIAGGAAALA